jgi:hypothetical protein
VVVEEEMTLSGVEKEQGQRARSAVGRSTLTLQMHRRRVTVVIVVAPPPSAHSCMLSASKLVKTI